MKIDELLKLAVAKGASDIHLAAGTPVFMRVDGALLPLEDSPLTAEASKELCYSILTEQQKKKFESLKELDFSYGISGVGRFRGNCYFQRGSVGATFRIISDKIPDFEQLGLPAETIKKLCAMPHGLVLVTGSTGSGKSTTLASMVNYINETRKCHIVTIEDPIEHLFKRKQSYIRQREVGSDTLSYDQALIHSLRQDPDVLLIGEIRDLESVSSTLRLAELGRLAFSTLHCGEAGEVINRVIDIFPANHQQQIRVQLSLTLMGVIAQQLLPRAGSQGRVLAAEVMIVTPAIRNLIREGKPQEIASHIQMGGQYGMTTMNNSLRKLCRENKITQETALNASANPKELKELLAKDY
jgi:twitching motility protein PilT